jgi:4,5-DOPA dioxygenase extradiol
MNPRMPALFLGHGNPMAAIEDGADSRAWRELARTLPRPKAVLAVSAHWVTQGAAVTAMAAPRTIHDFGRSFPQALFEVEYPAPGDPALASRVAELLAPARMALDYDWGLDHGAWAVLRHIYPDAAVPVVQLSLDAGLSDAGRFEVGRRLAPLRDEGVMILGSGNLVHNLPAMDWHNAAAAPFDWAMRFSDTMRRAIEQDRPDEAVGYAALGRDAELAAPTPEHLWPLFYVLGARTPGESARFFNDRIEHGSIDMTSFVLEADSALKAA